MGDTDCLVWCRSEKVGGEASIYMLSIRHLVIRHHPAHSEGQRQSEMTRRSLNHHWPSTIRYIEVGSPHAVRGDKGISAQYDNFRPIG